MDRRTFLRGAAALGGVAAAGGGLRSAFASTPSPLLSLPAKQAPLDTIVILMMENRSFDHYFGWLATDESYVDAGRGRYGAEFAVDGANHQTYASPDGVAHATYHLNGQSVREDPTRGCGHPDPGHGWDQGRAQRDGGFLAAGTGNDIFAAGYFEEADLPVYGPLARAFTTFDHYHAAIMSSTYPNRLYLLSAQTDGQKDPPLPIDQLGFKWPSIHDRLTSAGVSWANYAQDIPTALFFGARQLHGVRPLADFFADAAAGRLPRVSFVDPGFMSGYRTDDHPVGDHRLAQAFVGNVFRAFHASPQWRRGAMIVTYDEWGGFFDHVRPPVVPDDHASAVDEDNFGQVGFRVPTLLLSPFARPGYVDHNLYDHTSVLRFLEWRFLGAPAEGPGGGKWWLTTRDRYANNLGASLSSLPGADVHLDPTALVPDVSLACDGRVFQDVPGADDVEKALFPQPQPYAVGTSSMEAMADSGYLDRLGYTVRPSLTLAELTGQ
jgi:phospholipase C